LRLSRSDVPPLYAITDQPLGQLASVVQRLAASGVRWIQLRAKGADGGDLYEQSRLLVEKLPSDVRLFVNDRADVAAAAGAYGAHVGDRDLPPRLIRRVLSDRALVIGYSTHSIEDAVLAAEDDAVDYVAIGPIFRSSTKTVREPLGLEVLRSLRRRVEKPVVAIGGIDAGNIADVLSAGADSAAVIAALFAGPSIEANVRRLLTAAGAAGRK
jgi:thiamine-phosphate pyrophosphorylase